MLVLVHENHNIIATFTLVQHYCIGFDNANLVSSFLTKILNKKDFFEYEHLKRFDWRDDNISGYNS